MPSDRSDAHRGLDKRLVLQFSGKRIPNAKQLKHLPRFLSPREKTVIRRLGIVAALCLIAVVGRFGWTHLNRVAADGGEYAEAVVGTPRLVNPVLASSNDADLDILK